MQPTKEQKKRLSENEHLVAVAQLDGNCLLVCDNEPANNPQGCFGPYIMLPNGYVQGVNYFYAHTLNLDLPYN